jgi:O6-methylguanine-DNA--protein-cysteine methyltransferase
MSEADPQQQLEAKLIYAPRRVWKAVERIAAGERRSWRDQAAILLENACAEQLESVA